MALGEGPYGQGDPGGDAAGPAPALAAADLLRIGFPARRRRRPLRIGRRVKRILAPSMDHCMVRVVLALFVVYVAACASGLVPMATAGGPTLALILVPLWLVDGVKGLVESLHPATYRTGDEDLRKVTTVIASRNGEGVLEDTLADLQRRAMANVIVVSNGSTDGTAAVARRLGARCFEVEEPIGKVRAIEYALEHVATPYVLLIDDDTRVGDARIPTGLLDAGYRAVAFRLFAEVSTWVTRLQSYEYRKSADITKRFHNGGATVPNVSGAVGLFTLAELRRQTALHTKEFSGEDLQRTLLVHLAGTTGGVVLTDSIIYTRPPATLRALFAQRTRGWWPGLYSNVVKFARLLLRGGSPTKVRYDAFYNLILVVALDLVRAGSLPVLLLSPRIFGELYACYVALEVVPYLRLGRVKAPYPAPGGTPRPAVPGGVHRQPRREPLWVLLAFPLYGLFGFVTRLCACGVFLYRRLVAAVARSRYRDDYKKAGRPLKLVVLGTVGIGVAATLVCCLELLTTRVGRLMGL